MLHDTLKNDSRVVLRDLSYHDLGEDWENTLGSVIGFQDYNGSIKNSDGSDITRKIIVWVDDMAYEETFFDFELEPVDFISLATDIVNASSIEFIAEKLYDSYEESIYEQTNIKSCGDLIQALEGGNDSYDVEDLANTVTSILSKAIEEDFELYQELSSFLIDTSFDKDKEINTSLIGTFIIKGEKGGEDSVNYIQVGFMNEFDKFTGVVYGYEGGGEYSQGYFINGECINYLAHMMMEDVEDFYSEIIGQNNLDILNNLLFEDIVREHEESFAYLFDNSKSNMYESIKCEYSLVLTKGCSLKQVDYGTRYFD